MEETLSEIAVAILKEYGLASFIVFAVLVFAGYLVVHIIRIIERRTNEEIARVVKERDELQREIMKLIPKQGDDK